MKPVERTKHALSLFLQFVHAVEMLCGAPWRGRRDGIVVLQFHVIRKRVVGSVQYRSMPEYVSRLRSKPNFKSHLLWG